MKSSSKKALKSGIFYTISSFLIKSLGIITTPIFARILSQEDFGGYNNFASWLNIAMIVVTLNLESTMISARYDYKDRLDSYISSMIALNVLSVAFWGIAVNIFRVGFTELFSMDIGDINWMLVYLLFYPAFNLYQVRERYYYRYKTNVLMSILIAVSTAFVSITLVYVMDNKMQGRIIGSILPSILVGTIIFFYLIAKGKSIAVETWPYALKICIPYIPHLLSMTILGSTDRVMITKMCGAVDTALYSLAYTCGTLIAMLTGSINLAYSPWLSERIYKGEFESVKKMSKLYIAVPVFVGLGIMLVSPEIIYILGGERYLSAKYVMPSVTAGGILQFMYTMFVNIEQIKKKTVGMAFGSVSAAIMNCGLNFLLIPKFGYIIAAYTTLASYGWLLLVHMFLVKRMDMSIVYDYKFVGFMSIFTILMSIFISFLYQNNLLRFAAIIIYAILTFLILYRNRKVVVTLLKSVIK